MLRTLVLVSGGGTNLQAILDAVDQQVITNTEIVGVISNNKNAYALTRAEQKGIYNECISPKSYETRDAFNEAFLQKIDELHPDLIVLGRLSCCNPGADDPKIQKPYYQYSSVIDSVILWNRFLRLEST